MKPHLHLQQLTLMIGVGVVLAIIAIVAVYAIHKAWRKQAESLDFQPPRVRANDETGFTLAAMQAVIGQVKSEQKETQAKLVAAEQRADEYSRRYELVAREIEQGLIVFDRQGFITFANARLRELLSADTWSRRRYPEVFQSVPKLVELIGSCLEAGAETRKEKLEYQVSDEGARAVVVSVLPIRDRTGSIEAVACFLGECGP